MFPHILGIVYMFIFFISFYWFWQVLNFCGGMARFNLLKMVFFTEKFITFFFLNLVCTQLFIGSITNIVKVWFDFVRVISISHMSDH